jgi:SAM-dependent methyltransferase
MINLNTKILDESNFVEDCYVAQTKAFAPGEYLFLKELICKNDVKRVLDIGTGDGTFIHGLAKQMPLVFFDAVDADDKLISDANKTNQADNICFHHVLFDPDFPNDNYDLILSRFAVEHMPDVPGFISEAYKRLKNLGILLITEYYIDDLNSDSELWKLFRQKEFEFYLKFGSHPRISVALAKHFNTLGFAEIESVFRHISPSTIGREVFYNLIKTYAILYNNLDNEIFTDEIKTRIIEYSDLSVHDSDIEDGLFISHTTGRKG